MKTYSLIRNTPFQYPTDKRNIRRKSLSYHDMSVQESIITNQITLQIHLYQHHKHCFNWNACHYCIQNTFNTSSDRLNSIKGCNHRESPYSYHDMTPCSDMSLYAYILQQYTPLCLSAAGNDNYFCSNPWGGQNGRSFTRAK